jgi:REP element-mobilizing transposase RayT
MIDRQRKLNRWKTYDYSQNGCYFVTICIKGKMCLLGEANNNEMILNRYGDIVNEFWIDIPNHYNDVFLDEYIIMPNHIHGIIIIENNLVGTEQCSVPHRSVPKEANIRNYGLLSKIVKSFKESCVKTIRSQYQDHIFTFQRSFYDHIIRSEKSLIAIRQYIKENPLKWELNEDNPANWK